MARVVADDDGGPAAFRVRLSGVNKNGRPSDPERIRVNAHTAVQMIFRDASYVLKETLGCDMEQLQNDYDLYLLRPGTHDIVLNPSRAIADYGVGKNDELQFRRKEKPINICVDLYAGENRKITVNSGYPLTDVVAAICKEVGVEKHAELSLALPERSNKCMQLQWLDNASSLDGNGVNEGDTLLLRKKFFILNDDITEAIAGNEELKELIYQQIFQTYISENYVGGGVNDNYNCSLISALLHQIEQGGENISDDAAVCKMMPKNRREDMGFYTQIVTTYYQARIGTMDKVEAKTKLLQTLSQPQSIFVNYYPVKKASDVSEDLVVAIDSDQAFLCREEEGGKLKIVEAKSWKLKDVLDTDCTSLKEHFLRVNILGSWYEFVTSDRTGLSNYLLEARRLVKKRVGRGRMSTYIPSPPASTEPPILLEVQPELGSELEQEPEQEKEPEQEQEPKPVAQAELEPEPEPECTPTPPKNESQEPAVPSETKAGYEWPLNSPNRDNGQPVIEEPKDNNSEEQELPKLDLSSDIEFGAGNGPNLLHPGRSGRREKSPTKSMTSTSSYFHIPAFLGMDYREVLEKFHHFHVVVLDQNIRPALLEVQKTARETIDIICQTFCIPNASDYCLSVPKTEKRRVIGQKSTLSGTFKRKRQQKSQPEFNPILDDDKTLEEQYNFTVTPHLLHLRMRSDIEQVDTADEEEVDCGVEWPPNENRDVARYRSFYQSWTGIVQGAYPVEKKAAIKLAALLTQVYYGDKDANKVWPPPDYDCKVFLPDSHYDVFGISAEVDKEHRRLVGKSTQECINDVIDGCTRLLTYQGVFFDVSIPKKAEIMGVIPWNKMEKFIFGVNQHGIFKINRQTGKTIFTRRFSDIYQWTRTQARFQLNFKEWAEEFDAFSSQANEILDALQVFIKVTGKGRTDSAPSPLDDLSVQSLSKSGSPQSSTPRKSPINDFDPQSPKRSSTSSPTTYDL